MQYVKTFKNKLDKICKLQTIKYDYKAAIEINHHGQHPEEDTYSDFGAGVIGLKGPLPVVICKFL